MLTYIILILGNINDSGTLQFVVTRSFIFAILGTLIFLFVALTGNLILKTIREIKKPKPTNHEKLFKDIIRDECKEIMHKEIHLGVFANEIHYLVNKIVMYWRAGKNNEHIIILFTDKGCLVETFYDSFHARDEFIFICNEEDAVKEGRPISINLFHYKLFDNNLENEIKTSVGRVILGNIAAA